MRLRLRFTLNLNLSLNLKKMKIILKILILFLLFTQTTLATTLTVKQDSTGNYTIIQDAMDDANTGDTVLVWPGTYFENLNFNGKSLTLASLALTTGDDSYKYSTIIDGNHNGRCIVIEDANNAMVNGFTIQNGESEFGGGILVDQATVTVSSNIIKDNMGKEAGGGILVLYSTIILKGNSIFNNHSYEVGGGICVTANSQIVFDSINKNSVYLNYSSWGCEFYKSPTIDSLTLFLDTCTILNPDNYFFYSSDDGGYHKSDIEFIIQNTKLTPADNDLYVNPETGSNNNSGFSWEEPLKTIAFAYSKIAVDSVEKNTIHLANGLYSDTTNYEKFPLNVRQFTKLKGQSHNGVILDGNRNIYILKGNKNITDYVISSMTLQGGPIPTYEPFESRKCLADLHSHNHRFILDSVIFRDSYAESAVGILSYYQADSSLVKNCEFYGNTGGYSIRTSLSNNSTYQLSNNCFHNNLPDYDNPDLIMGYAFSGSSNSRGIMYNSLFHHNESVAIVSHLNQNLYLVNCTFSNNSIIEDYPSVNVMDADLHLYNCISYNEGSLPLHITVWESQKEIISHLNIFNSLIEGGENSINIDPSCDGDTWCKVHYDETNIDADPVFLGMWGHPYQIADGSPCIDAGTLARLPDFIQLPEKDLAGNPRIVGDSIDMGAYEWNSTIVGLYDYQPIKKDKPKLLSAAPNPFFSETTISAKWDFTGHVQIEVYNNSGLRVKVLKSGSSGKGSVQMKWEGDDHNGNILPAGIYHVVMFWGGAEVKGIKVVKL